LISLATSWQPTNLYGTKLDVIQLVGLDVVSALSQLDDLDLGL
jgi:hypothetical protein